LLKVHKPTRCSELTLNLDFAVAKLPGAESK
jgi:hypothetical protein